MDQVEDSRLDGIASMDSVVLVMGITGSGKSSFISELVKDDVQVGHDLISCTSGVNFFALELKTGQRIFLIDTPGFDDTYLSDGEVLKDIAFILAQLHRREVELAGIIYLHRITDNRLSGTAAKSLNILAKMCGENAYRQIVLVTTMWDIVQAPENNAEFLTAVDREHQLMQTDIAWRGMCSRGSRCMRWTKSENGWSSMAIVDAVMASYVQYGQLKLRVQIELVDEGMQLNDTEAGMAIDEELAKTRKELRKDMEALKAQHLKAAAERDSSFAQELSWQLKSSMERMERLEASQMVIKVGIDKLARDMQAEYRTILSHVLEEQRKAEEIMSKYQESYERLLEQERANIEVLKESQQQYEYKRYTGPPTEVVAVDEEQSELEAQFHEEQEQSKKQRDELEKNIRRQKKKKVMKANIVPLLQILAGIGATIGGGILMNPAIMVPGIGAILSGVSSLKFSDKEKRRPSGITDDDHISDDADYQ